LRDSSEQDGRGDKTLQVAGYGLAGHEFCVFVIPPPQEGCLSELLVFRPFRIGYFTDKLWLNPLDFLWDLGRILDRWFVCKERLEALDRIRQSFLTESGSRMPEVVELSVSIGAQQQRSKMLATSFSFGETARDEFLLRAGLNL
jgi:hypothetical protein